MKAILSLLLCGTTVFGHFMSLNDSVEATHQTVKALITEDRIQCRAQGLCPVNTPSIEANRIPCVNGQAGGYACSNIDLLSFINLNDLGCSYANPGCDGNDIWGWTDPVTGNHIAIVGTTRGTSFVDVTDPVNPFVIRWMHSNMQQSNTIWRDMKVLNDYVYIVADGSGQQLQWFDLTRLRGLSPGGTITPNGVYNLATGGGGNGRCHNIVINEDPTDNTQRAYLVGNSGCSGGLYAVDISNLEPQYAGCYAADGYTHDAQCVTYYGPDTEHHGKEICFGYNENTLTIVDFTNPNNPIQLSRTGYVGQAYTHQGWITEDQSFIFLDDELDESRGTAGNTGHARTYLWDVRDLDNPINNGFYENLQLGIDHNLYVKGSYVYEANYETGLRVLQFTTNVVTGDIAVEEAAFFDTYPERNGIAFNGAWSNYPYFDIDGYPNTIVVQDINRGLFVLQVTNLDDELAKSKKDYYKALAEERMANITKSA